MKKMIRFITTLLIIISIIGTIPVSASNPFDPDESVITAYWQPYGQEWEGHEGVFIGRSKLWNGNFDSIKLNAEGKFFNIDKAYKLLIGTDQLEIVKNLRLGSGSILTRDWKYIQDMGGFSVLVGYISGQGNYDQENAYGLTSYPLLGYCHYYKDLGFDTPYDLWLDKMTPVFNYIEYQWALIDKKITKAFNNPNKSISNDIKYTKLLKKQFGTTFKYTKKKEVFTTNYNSFIYYNCKDQHGYEIKNATNVKEVNKLVGIYSSKADSKCKKVTTTKLKKAGMPQEYIDKLVLGFELLNEQIDMYISNPITNKSYYNTKVEFYNKLEAFKIEMFSFINKSKEIANITLTNFLPICEKDWDEGLDDLCVRKCEFYVYLKNLAKKAKKSK